MSVSLGTTDLARSKERILLFDSWSVLRCGSMSAPMIWEWTRGKEREREYEREGGGSSSVVHVSVLIV